MRSGAFALSAATGILLSVHPVDAAAAECPRMSKESLAASEKLTTIKDPALDELYAEQTRIVARIKRLAESGEYSLDRYRALQKEHDEVKIAMERRRSENTLGVLKTLPAADQRHVLLSLYGGC